MPELDDLFRLVRLGGYCVNFADTNATMLVSRLPGGDAATRFANGRSIPARFSPRRSRAPTASGTALAEQRPILVHRDDHFREQWSTFSCAVAPVFDHDGQLAGAVNITSCRADLDRTAHQLALAVTVQAVRRIEETIFRSHFRDAWIAALPADEGGNIGLIAFDGDQRVLGASRTARQTFGLSDAAIDSGSALSQFIRLDADALRSPDTTQVLRHADGAPLGNGHLSGPAHVARQARPAPPRRPASDRRYDALTRFAGGDPQLQRSVQRLTRSPTRIFRCCCMARPAAARTCSRAPFMPRAAALAAIMSR